MKKECIAMVLAGGSGNRLKPLTRKLAKPAVLFGGKYRIIDFSLSNCINSGIDTLGILVQYEPLFLNSYISSRGVWTADKRKTSITILSPHMHEQGGCWYKGTANSVYQNVEFIDLYNPNYVIILSADQVYKMDYSLMLDFHRKTGADVTVAVTKVPWEDANRFGIVGVDIDNRIVEFDEKPAIPKNNLASMGIYIFNTDVLKRYLEIDECNSASINDFGKNIIPLLVQTSGIKVFAYLFDGYWRDVGTVKSFWEAHMDLLDEGNGLNLHDTSWNIYCDNPPHPPLYINHTAKVNSSLIGEGCYIQGEVYNSVLFPGVFVGRNSKIHDSVVMSNAKIETNTVINRTIIGSNAVVKSYCKVGEICKSLEGITYIDEGEIIEEHTVFSGQLAQ